MSASSARTELTFWLSIDLPLNADEAINQTVIIPKGFEVRSETTMEKVAFTTLQQLEVFAPLLAQVRREVDFNKNYLQRMSSKPFCPFNEEQPRSGDTFYLGFDPKNNLAGHLLRLEFLCEATEAVGIRRNDPPWVWECLTEGGKWQEIHPSKSEGEKDTTGGLNNESGQLVLYLPLNLLSGSVHGLDAFWLRCRLEQRNPMQGMYTESPRVTQVRAYTIGATVPAMHSLNVAEEPLGVSNGEPGQSFSLQNAPVLALQPGETVEVEEMQGDEVVFVPWKKVEDFSKSTRFDRHFALDTAAGTVSFGPSVRQSDGTVVQYGRIPENDRQIRFSSYRYGGGAVGNLPANSLTSLAMSLAYISRVSNLIRAEGGRDQETLEELKLRAQRELQAQRRAVTADDFEQFTKNCSRAVARARCLTPNDSGNGASGTVTVLVVPAVTESLRNHLLSTLRLPDALQAEIRAYLDRYRLMTVSLNIREPHYIGVKVKARVVPKDFIAPEEVARRVNEELTRYLTPLPLDDRPPLLQTGETWQGWVFGRNLFVAEIVSLIQQVPSVKYVLDVEVLSRPVIPSEEVTLGENEEKPLTPVAKTLRVPDDGLLVSLGHKVEIVQTDEN
jgi:predicted phage baseplate assembly protein